jgi:LPS-assembly lipoprotein
MSGLNRLKPLFCVFGYFRIRKLYVVLWLLLATVLWSGCGFHLRETAPLPESLQVLTLSFDKENSAWKSLVTRFFQRQGIRWQEQAPFTLVIHAIDIQKLPVSFSPQGKAVDIALTQTVRFSILEASGHNLTGVQSVSVQRIYQFDPKRITGKQQEEQLIIKEQRSELIYRLYDRFVFIAKTLQTPSLASPAGSLP